MTYPSIHPLQLSPADRPLPLFLYPVSPWDRCRRLLRLRVCMTSADSLAPLPFHPPLAAMRERKTHTHTHTHTHPLGSQETTAQTPYAWFSRCTNRNKLCFSFCSLPQCLSNPSTRETMTLLTCVCVHVHIRLAPYWGFLHVYFWYNYIIRCCTHTHTHKHPHVPSILLPIILSVALRYTLLLVRGVFFSPTDTILELCHLLLLLWTEQCCVCVCMCVCVCLHVCVCVCERLSGCIMFVPTHKHLLPFSSSSRSHRSHFFPLSGLALVTHTLAGKYTHTHNTNTHTHTHTHTLWSALSLILFPVFSFHRVSFRKYK